MAGAWFIENAELGRLWFLAPSDCLVPSRLAVLGNQQSYNSGNFSVTKRPM